MNRNELESFIVLKHGMLPEFTWPYVLWEEYMAKLPKDFLFRYGYAYHDVGNRKNYLGQDIYRGPAMIMADLIEYYETEDFGD